MSFVHVPGELNKATLAATTLAFLLFGFAIMFRLPIGSGHEPPPSPVQRQVDETSQEVVRIATRIAQVEERVAASERRVEQLERVAGELRERLASPSPNRRSSR